jgi:N-methylhydantoinase A
MPLSLARARQALEPLAAALGGSVEEAAADILAVAATVMARAIKVVSVERGHDPAEWSLIPFGGAGPLLACEVARELGMRRLYVPPSPGLLCAYGALAADMVYDFVTTVLHDCGPSLSPAAIAPLFLPLVQAATDAFDADAVEPAARRLERTATLRYRRQSFDLTLPLRYADGTVPEDLVALFHEAHRARYGHALDRPVELVTLRLRAVGKRAPLPPLCEPPEDGAPEIARTTIILDGSSYDAPVLARRRLREGAAVAGPALISEYSSTTLLPYGARATVLPSAALAIELA